jgi:hypothetical protein
MTELGSQFVKALAAKDRDALRALLAPQVDFRALTPNKFWEASSADDVIDRIFFSTWFDENDHVDAVESMEHATVVERERIGYRLHVTNGDGPHAVDQQAYFHVADGQIDWLRIMCAGYQPISA